MSTAIVQKNAQMSAIEPHVSCVARIRTKQMNVERNYASNAIKSATRRTNALSSILNYVQSVDRQVMIAEDA